jgi:hypothetical protein
MTPYGKAKRLVRLAVDPGTTDAERASAAMRACALIDKHHLLANNPLKGVTDKLPEDVQESVEAVSATIGHLMDPAFRSSMKQAIKAFRSKRRR